MMLKRGDAFGNYRVVSSLGQGGMGSVYLLENASGARVAAKILDPAMAGDHEARKRFVREAELALGVKHPNLVETYDVGEDPDTGLCYILMEYVPGGSLADRLAAGPLPIDEAIRITSEIASVLELAREKGIVHRDIKPANIMFGADGAAKLADLGIARNAAAGAETTKVTQTGMMMGTPAYMAPEQMFDAHNVDSRADIYSLGIVFYEMLTGVRPNKDDTVVELMAKAVKGERLPDVRKMRPEVSASIAKLISLMCETKADRRVQTAAEVTAAIMQIMRGEKLTLRRRSGLAAILSRKTLGVACAALALAGAAAVAYFGFSGKSGPEEPKPTVAAKPEVAKPAVAKPAVVKPKVSAKAVAKMLTSEETLDLLEKSRIPRISYRKDAPFREICEPLRKACGGKVNFLCLGERRTRTTITATDIAVHEVLRLVCGAEDCRFDVHNNIVMITDKDGGGYKWLETPRSDLAEKLSKTVIPRLSFKPPMTANDAHHSFLKASVSFGVDCGFDVAIGTKTCRPFPALPSVSLEHCSVLDALDILCQSTDCTYAISNRTVYVKRNPSALDMTIPVEAPEAYAKHKAKIEEILARIIPALDELMGGTLKLAIDRQVRKIVLSDSAKSWSVSTDGRVLTLPPTYDGFPEKPVRANTRVAVFLSDLRRFGHTEVCADQLDWYLSYRLCEMFGDGYDGKSKKPDLSTFGRGAKRFDPEMKLYDLDGDPVDGKAPELKFRDKEVYAMDKKQWLFQQMRARNEKAIAEYLKAWKREKDRGALANPVSQDDVAALFSLAVGEDLFDWFTEHGMPSSRERTRVKVNVPKKTAPLVPAAKAAPALVAPTPVPAVVGCDVSSHGLSNFYCDWVSSVKAAPFGKDARFIPLQFKLTDDVLDRVNLLVLTSTPEFNHYDFDDHERKTIREFAERGGVVLALVRATALVGAPGADNRRGESRGMLQRLLKSYGATQFNAIGKTGIKAVLVKDLEGAGPFVDPSCQSYAYCTGDWSPVAVAQDDPKKVISAVRPLGKGFLAFAHQQHASRVQGGTFVPGFPWDRIVLSRLKPVRKPDASFAGSALDDAPYEARSSRLRFVSSVMPEKELRKVAKMDDLAVEYLTRQFGKGAFDLHPAHNCIVGFSSPRVLPEWKKRLRDFDAIELKFTAPEKGIEGLCWFVCFARSLSPHWETQNSTEYSVATYMAAAAYDELRRLGYVTEADVGLADMIAFARKLDPDFTRYEKFGKPLSRETPELGPADKGKYIWGRYYARFEDLRKRRPDLLVRYRQVSQRRNGRNPTYDEFLDDLCEAYGSDWPRRWPAAEDKGER